MAVCWSTQRRPNRIDTLRSRPYRLGEEIIEETSRKKVRTYFINLTFSFFFSEHHTFVKPWLKKVFHSSLLLTRRVSLLIKVPATTPRDLWFTNLCKFWHIFQPIQIKYVKCWLTFWPIEIKYVNSKWRKQRCEAATSIWKMTLFSCFICRENEINLNLGDPNVVNDYLRWAEYIIKRSMLIFVWNLQT